MRNLREYPITKEEVIATLERILTRETRDGGIGNMEAYIVYCLKIMIERNYNQKDFDIG